MLDMQAIGKNIRFYRESCGLTQGEVAQRLFVSYQAVSAWERGLSVPDLENFAALADLFAVRMDMLLRQSGSDICIGIDGGGSKTEFCAFTADGTVHKRIILGPSNPNDVGKEACLQILEQGIRSVAQGLHPDVIFAGIAGAGVGTWKKQIHAHLDAIFGGSIFVDSDAAGGLSLGSDPENSMLVICGTGSCVFVRKQNKAHVLGGWGQLFDESGSAYDVGKDAIRHTLAVWHSLEPRSSLSDRIAEALGGDPFKALGDIYSKGRPYIASFAVLTVKLAAEGDIAALAILEKNAARLSLLIRTAREKYGTPHEIVASGSFIRDPLYRRMVEGGAGCSLTDPKIAPVYGCCVEALRRAGMPLPYGFRENFEKSYGGTSC